MTISLRFYQVQPWAVLPAKVRVDRAAAREKAELFFKHFRYVRAERRPEFCPPWVMGQELGWRVCSPIDVTFTQLSQIEIDAQTGPDGAARAANRSELWKRDRSHLAVGKTSWLHLYQFQTDQGWENMFTPNGVDSVEWRLGWGVDLPRGYFLLVLPSDPPGALQVPIGVMSSTVTTRISNTTGMSLAIRPPSDPVTLKRGQEIARIIPLHADSLQAVADYDPAPDASRSQV